MKSSKIDLSQTCMTEHVSSHHAIQKSIEDLLNYKHASKKLGFREINSATRRCDSQEFNNAVHFVSLRKSNQNLTSIEEINMVDQLMQEDKRVHLDCTQQS